MINTDCVRNKMKQKHLDFRHQTQKYVWANFILGLEYRVRLNVCSKLTSQIYYQVSVYIYNKVYDD
jgi:hypothetical protein